MINIDPSIFKSYDIRGIYPDQINKEVAYRFGRAYGQFLKEENKKNQSTIIVSRDMRLSGGEIHQSLVEGLMDQGINVVDIGLASTPTMYFAVAYYGYDGGIQVTASHNPKEYNGFKLVRKNANPISGQSGIPQIRDMVIANKFADGSNEGKYEKRDDILDKLSESCQKEWPVDYSIIKPFEIVADAGNAMGAIDMEVIFKPFPCHLIKINFDIDGSFPAHHPDPTIPENLKSLQETVIDNHADLGIATDGDGDRYIFVDEKGQLIRNEIIRAIVAETALDQYPGAAICSDIRPGRITQDVVTKHGGINIFAKAGNPLVKEKMIENNAVFGGESSGHYFHKMSYGTFEVPVVLVRKFIEFISKQNKPVSEIVAPYKVYFHSGEINMKVADVKTVLDKIAQNYSNTDVNLLDGVTVTNSDWWFNIRGSNTEPLVRLNLEAKSQEIMEQKRDEVLKIING